MTQESNAEGWKPLMGEDLQLKTLQAAPEGADEVQVHDVVRIRFTGRPAPTIDDVVLNDNNDNDNEKEPKFPIFHATSDDDDCFWLQVGAAGVVPALEMAVRFLSVGETAVVWSHSKYAYGAVGRTANNNNNDNDKTNSLPPYTAVAYHVTVVDKVDVQHSVPNRLAFAHARKRQANDAYQHEWANGAGRPRILQAYQRLASDMEALVTTLREANDNDNNDNNNNDNNNDNNNYLVQAQQLRIDALNNVTAVWLRDKQYKKAKEAAVAVLQLEPTNFKALTRAAKAALLDPASEFAEVQAALEAAAAQVVTHDHNDALQADVEQLQTIFQRRKQMYEAKSKQMYKNAFAKKSSSSSGGGRNDAGDVNKDTTTSTASTTTTVAVDTPATSDSKEDQAMAKESKPSSAPSAAPKTGATPDDDDDTTTTTTSSDWWWQYGLPYGFQILLFLSMLAYVVWYHHTESSDPRTTAPVQDEF